MCTCCTGREGTGEPWPYSKKEDPLGNVWSTEEAVTGDAHARSMGSLARGRPVGGGSTKRIRSVAFCGFYAKRFHLILAPILPGGQILCDITR